MTCVSQGSQKESVTFEKERGKKREEKGNEREREEREGREGRGGEGREGREGKKNVTFSIEKEREKPQTPEFVGQGRPQGTPAHGSAFGNFILDLLSILMKRHCTLTEQQS